MSTTYIAGHTGLVGSALLRRIPDALTAPRQELDLTDQSAVDFYFSLHQPRQVFLAAAKVGGIHANSTYPANFIYDNLFIQANVIEAAYRYGATQKLLFLGSSCIYPRDAQQPMRADALLTGPLEPTNEYYAIAKIAGLKLCQAYRKQYGFNAIAAMPTNLYGPNDHFDSVDAHVIPSLMSRLYRAALNGDRSVTVWGSGRAKREFLHVDDLADALITLMAEYNDAEPINVGSGQEVTIRDLAYMVAEVVGYRGKILFDSTKPDGPPRKLVDSSRIRFLGWRAKISLYDGLRSTFDWYRARVGESGSRSSELPAMRNKQREL
jgi:GDP-L-fucose synthase